MKSLKTPEKNYQNSIAAPEAIDVSTDELMLAYHRTKAGRWKLRGLVEHPDLHEWIIKDLDSWIEKLCKDLAVGYRPSPSRLCWVPESKSFLRPANILTLADEVVYSLLAGRLHEDIWNAIGKYQGDLDMGHELYPPFPGRRDLVENNDDYWDWFNADCEEKMKSGDFQYAVFTDIIGFYENIDYEILLSDLWQITDLRAELHLLGKCLRKWSDRKNRGIPPAYPASHMFAKVYVRPIDSGLRKNGYTHLRHVDDIRIFCKSRSDAKRALTLLSDCVHKRGLNLHPEKTQILNKSDALSAINYVSNAIYEAHAKIIKMPESNEEILMEYLSYSIAEPFNRFLFIYILAELRYEKYEIAAEICMNMLLQHPELTDDILEYFESIKLSRTQIDGIFSILNSPDLIYDYQAFQILKWLKVNKVEHEKVLNACREWSKDRDRDPWLRSYAIAYIGEYGDDSDLESIESLYDLCANEML
jgi:hypothetical protein